MIGELLFVTGLALLCIRICFFDKVSSWMVGVECVAGIMLFTSILAIALASPQVITNNILINGPSGNYVITGNSMISTGPQLKSWELPALYMSVLALEVLVVVFLINDCSVLFFPKKASRPPEMPRW